MAPRTRKTGLIIAAGVALLLLAAANLFNPFSTDSNNTPDPTGNATAAPDTSVPTKEIPLRTGTITLTLHPDDRSHEPQVYESTIQICDLHLNPPGIIATNLQNDPPIHIELSQATGNQLVLVTNPDNPATHTGDTTWTGTPQLDTTNTTATATTTLTETTTRQTATTDININCPEL